MAARAVEGIAAAQIETFDRCVADATVLALPSVDVESLLEPSALARSPIVADGGAAFADRGAQHLFDFFDQLGQVCMVDRCGRGRRVNSSAEEGFAGVYIADSDDGAIVHDEDLDRAFAALAQSGQVAGIEGRGEWLGAQFLQVATRVFLSFFKHQQQAEAPRVVVDQSAPVVEGEGQVIVFFTSGPEKEISAHTEMDQQGAARSQVEEQEFGAAPGGGEIISNQRMQRSAGQGLAQPLVTGVDASDRPIQEMALHRAADGLDFGKFWHGAKSIGLMQKNVKYCCQLNGYYIV